MPNIYKMSNAGGFKSLTRYQDMLAGNTVWNPWSPEGAYDALATVTLASSASNLTFTGIPSTYKHLQIRLTANSDAGNQQIRFNSDSSSNYSFHYLTGQGSVAQGGSSANDTGGYMGYSVGSSYPFSTVVDILDYANTSKYKTIRCLGGQDYNGTASYIMFTSSSWRNTSAVNSIYLYNPSGNYAANSTFALYGVK